MPLPKLGHQLSEESRDHKWSDGEVTKVGKKTYDYSHVLSPEHQKQGFQIHTVHTQMDRRGATFHHVASFLKDPKGKDVGAVEASIDHKGHAEMHSPEMKSSARDPKLKNALKEATRAHIGRGIGHIMGKSEDSKLLKVAPPDISEKTMHKLKAQYPGNEAAAFATAWKIHNEKKGKLKKDATDMAFGMGGPKTKLPRSPKLPGMTPRPNAPIHPVVAQSLAELRAMARPGGMHHETAASLGALKTPATPPPIPTAAQRSPIMKRKTLTAERGKTPVGGVTPTQRAQAGTAERKPGGGMSFLKGLISKFRLGKTTVDEANHEMGKFKSLAHSPTAMPQMPGMGKPAAKKSPAGLRGTPAHSIVTPKLPPTKL